MTSLKERGDWLLLCDITSRWKSDAEIDFQSKYILTYKMDEKLHYITWNQQNKFHYKDILDISKTL